MSRSYRYYGQIEWNKGSNILNKDRSRINYVRYMLDRTQSMFKYDNLPETIPQRMLELYLQTNGLCIIAEHQNNLYAFIAGLGGEPDEYYRPTIAVVSNPALKLSKEYKIDKDCVVMLNDSLFEGLLPMFNRYATLLVENDISLRTADINLRLVAMITASDDKTKKAAELYLKQIEEGKLAVVGQNAFLAGVEAQPMLSSASNYLVQLIEYQQFLKAGWFNDIGIQANYNMKRENLNEAETKMNNSTLIPLIDDMLNCRQEALDKINKMFGTDIKVSLDSAWEVEHNLQDDVEDNQELDSVQPEKEQIEGEDNGEESTETD